MRSNILLILIGVGCWPIAASALPQNSCSQIKYTAPHSHSKEFRLSRVEGQAVYASPTQKWELGSGNGLCVALFKRPNSLFVNAVTTDGRGQFDIPNLTPGEYVLIAFAGDLNPLVIPVQVVAAEKTRPQRLLLHLREKEDKRKSFATAVTNPALRKELVDLVGLDQNIRNELIKSGVDPPDKAIMARMEAIDLNSTARMRSIIKEFGWPDAALVGWDGTQAAFTLVQHSTHLFQKELLPLMKRKFKSGDLAGPNYALFLDRVLVEDGKPQVYGTRGLRFDEWKGDAMLYTIMDEANVDKRRAEVGLSSLAEYRRYLRQMYFPQKQ